MIRMLVGMVLRMSDIMTLENASTAVTDMPITMAGSSFAVTASTEQMPSICTTTGLLRDRGFRKTCLLSVFSAMAVKMYCMLGYGDYLDRFSRNVR